MTVQEYDVQPQDSRKAAYVGTSLLMGDMGGTENQQEAGMGFAVETTGRRRIVLARRKERRNGATWIRYFDAWYVVRGVQPVAGNLNRVVVTIEPTEPSVTVLVPLTINGEIVTTEGEPVLVPAPEGYFD